MAKLAVLFLFGLLLVQFVAAGKIKRDAPQANDNKLQHGLEDTLDQLQNLIKNAFSKEQFEALQKQTELWGNQFAQKGKELLDSASQQLKASQNA